MNEMVPIGYAKTSMGRFLAGAIAVGALLLTVLFVKSGADFIVPLPVDSEVVLPTGTSV